MISAFGRVDWVTQEYHPSVHQIHQPRFETWVSWI